MGGILLQGVVLECGPLFCADDVRRGKKVACFFAVNCVGLQGVAGKCCVRVLVANVVAAPLVASAGARATARCLLVAFVSCDLRPSWLWG